MNNIKQVYMYALGALIVVGFFVLLYLLLAFTIPIGNIGMLNIVVGSLIGSFATVVGYFFGSSKSSGDKDATIKEMVTNSKL